MTQKEILLRALEEAGDWVISYKIIKVDTAFGWLGTSADAHARKLRREGLLESKDEGQYVMFRITDRGREWLDSRDTPALGDFRRSAGKKEEGKQGKLI